MEGNVGLGTTKQQTSRDLPKPQTIEAGWIADHIISLFVRACDYSKIHSEASSAIMRFGQEEFQRGMQYQTYLDDLATKLTATPQEVANKIAEALTPPPLPDMESLKSSYGFNESLNLKAIP